MKALQWVGAGVGVVGFLVLIAGVIVGWVVAPSLIESMVKEEAQLKEGTEIYEKWEEIPVPIYFKVYVWHIQNAADFQNTNDWSNKMVMEEKGPYVYREIRHKDDIVHYWPDDTVFFRETRQYIFERNMSVGPDDELIDTINVPLFSIAAVLMGQENPPLPPKNIMELLLGPLSEERLVKLNVPIREVIFGWRLNFAYDLVTGIGANIGLTFPPELQNGRFGYYLNRNNTNANGLWEVYSGIEDFTKFNTIRSIDLTYDMTHFNGTHWWNGTCAQFRGTDGTMFPPLIEKDDIIYVFALEICRWLWFEFDSEMEYEGIEGYRFIMPDAVYASPETNPDNECFWSKRKEPIIDQHYEGICRIFDCKSGAPIFISKPHFVGASSEVRDSVVGMAPDRAKHESVLDLEFRTGLPLQANVRLQIGLEIQPLSYPDGTTDLGAPWNTTTHAFVPALWVDQAAALDEPLVEELEDKLVKPLRLLDIGKWTVTGVGIALTLAGSALFSYLTWFKK